MGIINMRNICCVLPGQAAYGNMCRGGRMFAPTHTWRKWHHKVPNKQRRYALASAVAATAIPALVEAKGHIISKMSEIPMVITNEIEGISKTKEAVAMLKKINAYDDVEKAIASRRLRGTKGKMRNRRWRMKRGPLVIYKNDNGITRAFRNVPSVSLMSTDHMNLLKLAPGGHVGRLVIWSQDAFQDLNKFFGDYKSAETKLPVSKMEVSITNYLRVKSNDLKDSLFNLQEPFMFLKCIFCYQTGQVPKIFKSLEVQR